MIESFRTRWIVIGVIVTIAFFWLLPNFVDLDKEWPLSKDKIIYGLDIQGGLHLVLGVDVDEVVKEKTKRMAVNLRADLKDKKLVFKSVTIPPENPLELRVDLGETGELAVFDQFIEKYYSSLLQNIETNGKIISLRYFDSVTLLYKRQILEQAIEVIRNRIDEFGVSEPNITSQGDNRILVQLPGIEDSAKAKDLINRTAKLEFQVVSEEKTLEELTELIEDAENAGKFKLGGEEKVAYSVYIKKLNDAVKDKLPKSTRIVFMKNESAKTLEAGKVPLLLRTDANLTGDQLEDANVRRNEFGQPEVIFHLSIEGRRRFAKLTAANVKKRMAIVLDDVVKSSPPTITEKIDSATAQITLGSGRNPTENFEEAQMIATSLRAGALPATLEQLEERTVGPTLGADSIARGKNAGYLGGFLVLVFMLFYYGKLGAVADIVLALNVVLILALLSALGATLTLPGVAGIVLTIGMAVDANVIIFERIKEELRKGSGLHAAVKDGFGHAFSAIFDANITTAAVCIVLMYFGTGPVRGFAVTLLCGILTSMFTALFVARTLIEHLIVKMNVKQLVAYK